MAKKFITALLTISLLAFFSMAAVAQESAVKGNLAGVVTDASGAVVPGAKVSVTGPTGTTTVETNSTGAFTVPLLTPGFYGLKVEKEGFKAADVKNVEVVTNKTASVRIGLEPGQVSEVVEVSAATVTVDTSATAVSANLTDTFYSAVPVGRSVTSLFYASPGVVGGGGTGAANPSIGGGTGLENQYIADGVNITDGAFGGIGVYSRLYGSLSTGINLSFIKEVQVKTAALEPQYGKSTGGVVQIVTKSGGNEFHGAIGGFFAPQAWEKERLHPDDFGLVNRAGKRLHEAAYDVNGEVGGYVPGFRENVFFFGSVNPSWKRFYDEFLQFPVNDYAGNGNLGDVTMKGTTWNYAAKGTFRLNDNHNIETSIFGDPTQDDAGPWGSLAYSNHTGDDEREYGTRNIVARYNGTWTPTWLFNTSWSWGHNKFETTPVTDIPLITDVTQTTDPLTQRGSYNIQGYGFIENTEGDNFQWATDTQKTWNFWGTHTTSIGYQWARGHYDGDKERSGSNFIIPECGINGEVCGDDLYGADVADLVVGQENTAQYQLRIDNACTLCPLLDVPQAGGGTLAQRVYLRTSRGDYFGHVFETESQYHTVYGHNSWAVNKYLTFNAGLRWEQHTLTGNDDSYTFTGNWSPRMGLIVDPFGDRKTKISANFARMSYAIPLDMAIRALSDEKSLFLLRVLPPSSGGFVQFQPDGTLGDIQVTEDTILNRATGGSGGFPFHSGAHLTAIAPGTKMTFLDEWTVAFERELPGSVIFTARYNDRRLKRAVEDTSALSVEGALAGLSQSYVIGNVDSRVDNFVNEPASIPYDATDTDGDGVPDIAPSEGGGGYPAGCLDSDSNGRPDFESGALPFDTVDALGNPIGVCYPDPGDVGAVGADGLPDGFPDVKREYQAMEFEFNKSFSKNWQMRANWRIARLQGNFEGAFRNDNLQSDPSITSLYDFTAGSYGLLGTQFDVGPLNTDRRHVVNGFFSYVFDRGIKGLTLGTSVRFETGTPLNQFMAHPAYLNAGEIPFGGRGALGRTEENYTVDLKVDYPFQISERQRLRFGIDLFNITNQKKQLRVNQNLEVTTGTINVDYLKPVGNGRAAAGPGFQRPFYARAMVRWEF